jgi:predicted small lipoprotein YifL
VIPSGQIRPSLMTRAAIFLAVLAVLISGCGYKGPLYLPKPKPDAQKPAPKPAPAQDEKKTEEP